MSNIAMTKEQLLKMGLNLLDTSGHSSLKISQICTSLNLTKGAFYHWFKSKEEFNLSLLVYWRELFTSKLIEDANRGGSSQDKLVRIIQLCIDSAMEDSRLEIEINMWGHQDMMVGEFVGNVYQERFLYLVNLLEDIYQNKAEAKRHALILYSLISGVDLFYKRLSKDEMTLIFKDYLN